MANDCFTTICLRGSLSAIKEVENICKYDYDIYDPRKNEERHFMRIRDYIGIYDLHPLGGGLYCAYMQLDCAWSAYSCIFSGSNTYYNSWVKNGLEISKSSEAYKNTRITTYDNSNYCFRYLCNYGPWAHDTDISSSNVTVNIPGGPIMCTTLPYECYRLGLDAEVWTEEPGMGFQEHYRIYHGVVVVDECLSMQFELINENTKHEELQNKYPNMEIDKEYFNILQDELKADKDNDGYYIDIKYPMNYEIDCMPNMMCGHVMCEEL